MRSNIYRSLLPIWGLFLSCTLSGGAQPRECFEVPVLFSDDGFQGRSLPVRDSVEDLHRVGMGDEASSICVPSRWRVVVYEDTGFGGDQLELVGPTTISDLKRRRPQGRDWGDRISAVRVYPPRRSFGQYQGRLPRDCDRYPVLFKSDTFRGDTARLTGSNPDLHRSGMGDEASSVCVPDGWRIVVYEDTGYRGDRLEIYGPDAIQDLKRDRPGGRDWGDRISSVQVEPLRDYRRRPSENRGVVKDPRAREYDCRYPTVFGSEDYRGRRLELNDSVRDLRRAGFGDSISSVCVPRGYTIVLYEYSDYRGRSMQLAGGERIPRLEHSQYRNRYWGDRFGSVQVSRSGVRDPYSPPDPYGSRGPCRDFPILYSDDGFRGAALELRSSIRDLHDRGFGDDASSVCVPRGWTVVLYEHEDFRGDALRLSGDQSIADLGRDRPQGDDWGDRISSVEVRRDR